jgi:hypothetical protein
LIGFGLIAGAVVLAAATLIPAHVWYQQRRLRDDGASALATVTRTETDLSGRFAADVVHYEYQVAGQGHPRGGAVRLVRGRVGPLAPLTLFQKSQDNSLVVRYLMDDPEVFGLDGMLPDKFDRARTETVGYGVVAGLMWLVGGSLLVWEWSARQHQSPRRR